MENKKTEIDLNEAVNHDQKFNNASDSILGCPVILRVNSNDTYHGIFVTYSPDFDVLLECCHKIDPDNEVVIFGRSLPKPNQVQARFFERENIVEMTAFEVDKDFALKSAENNFIDAAIAARVHKTTDDVEQCKELEPFPFDNVADEDDDLEQNSLSSSTNNLDGDADPSHLELELNSNSGWDAEEMLKTNQQKYGYKSTYNSDLLEYTIPVEKEDTEEYRRREREAEKLAAEIESSASYRRNIDKELSDNEEEEEAFSAVVRGNEINNNNIKEYYKNDKFQRRSFRKIIKNQRSQPQQQLQNKQRTTPNNKQTIDKQSSTSSNQSYKQRSTINDKDLNNKKYPNKYQNLNRQSSTTTNTALFSY